MHTIHVGLRVNVKGIYKLQAVSWHGTPPLIEETSQQACTTPSQLDKNMSCPGIWKPSLAKAQQNRNPSSNAKQSKIIHSHKFVNSKPYMQLYKPEPLKPPRRPVCSRVSEPSSSATFPLAFAGTACRPAWSRTSAEFLGFRAYDSHTRSCQAWMLAKSLSLVSGFFASTNSSWKRSLQNPCEHIPLLKPCLNLLEQAFVCACICTANLVLHSIPTNK